MKIEKGMEVLVRGNRVADEDSPAFVKAVFAEGLLVGFEDKLVGYDEIIISAEPPENAPGWSMEKQRAASEGSPITKTETDMECEKHPGREWPHGDCPGPGIPKPPKDVVATQEKPDFFQDIADAICGRVHLL